MGTGWPKVSGRRDCSHQPFFLSENYAKWSFVWYKNLDRSFFYFVTNHARVSQTDRQTDGQTEFSSLDRICIACSAVKSRFFDLLDSTCYKHRLLEYMLSLVKLNRQMNSISKAALLKVVTTDNGIWIPTKLTPCTWKLQILCCDWWTCHDPETWEASQLPDIRRLCWGVHEQRVRNVSRLSHKGRHRFIGKHSMKASSRKKRVGRELDQFVR